MEGSSKNVPVINFDLINPPSYHPKDGVIPNRNQYGDVNTPSHLRKRTDKSRMPKLAAVLLIVFFLLSGVYQVIFGLEIEASTKRDVLTTYDHLYYNYTFNQTQRLNQLIYDMSQPNLINGNPVILPKEITNLADIHIKPAQDEVPFFWHVPRSGGGTLKNIVAYCLDLTQASELGALLNPESTGLEYPATLVDTITGAKFINVDSTSIEGLEQARPKDVGAYDDLDLVVSPYLYDATEMLFNNVNRGRMFVMFRHPIERAVSMYYYLKKRNDADLQVGDSLLNYAKGNLIENNWMTRFLTNKLGGELTHNDEVVAKEVLRSKALIGLLKHKNESMQRFKQYFNWRIDDSNPIKVQCEEKYLEWGYKDDELTSSGSYKMPSQHAEEFKILKSANAYDIRLYEYAEKLFEVQGLLLNEDHIDYSSVSLPDISIEEFQEEMTFPEVGEDEQIDLTDAIPSSATDGDVIDLIASNVVNDNQ